ncbi:PAS domain-containing protein [Ferrovibrio terrae]|uniref:PAS domain-containing protein n=2 Tax=Ferrovibrio terrae TaxID=2594003 RepID=A0A516GYZ4_9PROT|nr:PAS domain-containing protein [Ferrovibrio terrae]
MITAFREGRTVMQYDFASLMDDLTLEPHRALAAHWLDLYATTGGGIPRVTAIDALSLGRHLPDICILNHDGGNVFSFRLAGGHVNDFYGREVRGKLLTDLVSSPTRERLIGMAHAILRPPAAILHGMSGMLPQWNYSVALQRLSLPLTDATGRVRHIISATVHSRHAADPSHDSVDIDFQRQYRIPAIETGNQATAS